MENGIRTSIFHLIGVLRKIMFTDICPFVFAFEPFSVYGRPM